MSAIVDFVRTNLFWIISFLVVVLILWIYSTLDNATKLSVKKIFSGKLLTFIALCFIWFIWFKRGGSSTFQTANFYMPLIALLILTGYNYIGGLRYETQQIQCANGFHGSYCKMPKRIGGFLIFAIDSFNAGGFSWEFASRILVLREETCEFCDEGCISISRPTPCSTGSFDLPPEVKEYIDNNKFLKGRGKPVFYGWFDDIQQMDYDLEKLNELHKNKTNQDAPIYNMLKKELGVTNPSIDKLFWLYRNQCKATNKQTEQYDATIDAVEKGVEHSKRVKGAYVDRGSSANELKTGSEEY